MSQPLSFTPDSDQVARLLPMLDLLQADPASLSSVTDPERAFEVHLLDSLTGTIVEQLEKPDRVVDIGSGAGFPGIPLASARPESEFDLIDSVGRKVEFIRRVADELGLDNVRAIKIRSEDLASSEGRETYDVATARAVASLPVLAELASPLLREGGVLVAWKGARDPADERNLAAIEGQVAMRLERIHAVIPFPSSRTRHLYVLEKTGQTPSGLPRRPGMARKRPFTG